jgi:hypothetical protein
MTVQINLTVNDNPIMTDYFVAGFIDHTVSGMIESLEGTGEIKELKLTMDGNRIDINLNGCEVPINEFVTRIIRSTTIGMLSPLKGVTQPVKKVDLMIKK